MVGKNNLNELRKKNGNRKVDFSIKKLSVGVASVAVASTLIFGNMTVDAAESDVSDETTVTEVPTPEEPVQEDVVPVEESADEVVEETTEEVVEEPAPPVTEVHEAQVLATPVTGAGEEADGPREVTPDTTAPTIDNVTIDKETYEAGETVAVTVTGSDEGVVTSASVSFQSELVGESTNYYESDSVNADLLPNDDGTYTFTSDQISQNVDGTFSAEILIELPQTLPATTFNLTSVSVRDEASNGTSLTDYEETLPANVSFAVTNPNGDTTPPEVTEVTLDQTEYEAGDIVSGTFTGYDDQIIESVSISFEEVAEDQTYSDTLNAQVYNDVLEEGTFNSEGFSLTQNEDGTFNGTFRIQLAQTMPSKTFTLSSIYAADEAGNTTNLSQGDPEYGIETTLPNLLSFNVTNPNGDVTPPTITEVTLDQTEYQAGDKVTGTISGNDDQIIDYVSIVFENTNAEGGSGPVQVYGYAYSPTSDIENPENEELINQFFTLTQDENGDFTGTFEIQLDVTVSSATYRLLSVSGTDEAGNNQIYSNSAVVEGEPLPNELEFTLVENSVTTVIPETEDTTTPPDEETPTQPGDGGSDDQTPGDGGTDDQTPGDGGTDDQTPGDGGTDDQTPDDGGTDDPSDDPADDGEEKLPETGSAGITGIALGGAAILSGLGLTLVKKKED